MRGVGSELGIGPPLIRRREGADRSATVGQNDRNQAMFWPFWFGGKEVGRRRRGGVVLDGTASWLPHAKWSHYVPLCRDWSLHGMPGPGDSFCEHHSGTGTGQLARPWPRICITL